MPRPKPQFRAHLAFTFAEHGEDRWRAFVFDESGHRRIPMSMDGVEGFHTVGMWIDRAGRFQQGDKLDVDCCVIWPEGFREVVKPGVRFRLWDGGFFADGTVTERFDDEWETS
jgi:hypothetical protein